MQTIHDRYAGLGSDAMKKSFFTASNPTPLTGIATKAAPTSLSATAGLCNIFNTADANANPGSNIWVIPIRMIIRAVGINTGSTSLHLIGYLDVIDRYDSGGTTLTNVSQEIDTASGWSALTPKARIEFGDLTFESASAAKKVMHVQIAGTILAADDTLELWFGEGVGAGLTAVSPFIAFTPRVRIGRLCNLSIHEVSPSQSADSVFEVMIEWAEVGHDSPLAA